MLNKKNIKMHLLSLFILCTGFVLCRYVFFDVHGMKQLPASLFGVGIVFLAISFFLRCKMAPIIIALAYLIGFVAGVVFGMDGIDAGGGATNNLWIIWTTVFICFSVICIITESAYSTKKRICKSKSDKEKVNNRNANRKEFDSELEELLRKAEALIPEELLPDLPFMKEAPDVHDWYMFEHELWGVGEEIRQLTLKYKKKFDKSQLDRIANICLDKRAKRGRQSFVLLLGRKQYVDYADKIVTVLEDEDVDGHVINTLYKMQAGQYVELMKPFLNHKRTWIKNEAKRFINKFEGLE